MSCATLGETFDIHGGGADLQFPHHENEIAQSEGATGKPLARFWVHNGFVRVDNEKMSKSLGNFFTIRDVLKQYDAETVRFFIVRAHYRSALNYSDAHLDDARQSLKRLYTALSLVAPASVAIDWAEPHAARFKAAMDEDFGTPEAIAVLFDLASEVNKTRSAELAGLLKALAGCLGLLQGDPQGLFAGVVPGSTRPRIQAQIAARAAAKAAQKTSPRLTASAMPCWPRASCSRTRPLERPGKLHSDFFECEIRRQGRWGEQWQLLKM
jgi:cysteinyl-tRNA synthetase